MFLKNRSLLAAINDSSVIKDLSHTSVECLRSTRMGLLESSSKLQNADGSLNKISNPLLLLKELCRKIPSNMIKSSKKRANVIEEYNKDNQMKIKVDDVASVCTSCGNKFCSSTFFMCRQCHQFFHRPCQANGCICGTKLTYNRQFISDDDPKPFFMPHGAGGDRLSNRAPAIVVGTTSD